MALTVKTPEMAQQQLDFINEANQGQLVKQDSIWSLDGIKRLSEHDLIERLFQVTNQSLLVKWRLFWELRQRYPSDRKFGEKLNQLRNDPTYADCIGASQDINRALNAGRFCEKHRIIDLNKTAIYQSAIYELSRPMNIDVADDVYKRIKGKHVPVYDVIRMINEAKGNVVLTIEQPSAELSRLVEQMDLDQLSQEKRFVPVVKNVAIEGNQQSIIESSAVMVAPEVAERAVNSLMQSLMTEEVAEVVTVEPMRTLTRRQELLQELALMDASGLTIDEQADEIMLLVESYRLSFIRQIPVFQACIKKAQAAGYK